MIIALTEEGGKNRKGEKEVYKFLDILANDPANDYIVGVDYASTNSIDYTAVTYSIKDENGNMVVKGIELVE